MRKKLKLLNFGLMLPLVVIVLAACSNKSSFDVAAPVPPTAAPTATVAQVAAATTAPIAAATTAPVVAQAATTPIVVQPVGLQVTTAAAIATPAGDPRSGEVLYKWSCSRCHPNGGTVAGPTGQPILATDKVMTNPAYIRDKVRNGAGGINSLIQPVFTVSEIKDTELNDIVAFLTAARKDGYLAPTSTPIPVPVTPPPTNTPYPIVTVPTDKAGKTLEGDQLRGDFIFKRACQVCHTNGGRTLGANGQPNLSIDPDTWRPGFVRDFIANGSPAGMPKWSLVLSPQEIEDLVAYVNTLNTSSDRLADAVATGLDAATAGTDTPAPTTTVKPTAKP